MIDYHSYYARVVEGYKGEIFVKIVDRYWPGGPNPDYLTLVLLTPDDAMTLANDLIDKAIEADERQNRAKIKTEIALHINQIAKTAKEEACE